ncbi:MAG: hypothetical protein HUU10_15380 [Bacteroidetes bacterium]|nr:hypothetical protein [Bacteroidota bacterium]
MKTTEIAVYKIKPEIISRYDAIRKDALTHLKTHYTGLEQVTMLASEKDPALFADILIWKSSADFNHAAGSVMNDPALGAFMECMADSVVFEHFHVTGEL